MAARVRLTAQYSEKMMMMMVMKILWDEDHIDGGSYGDDNVDDNEDDMVGRKLFCDDDVMRNEDDFVLWQPE